MAFNLTENNPWLGFAEDYPEAMYRAFIPQGQPRSFLDYFRRQYGDIYGDYMGGLAGQALQGQAPNQQFSSFLSQYPFLANYLGLPPAERGERAQQFAPRLRWQL